MNLLIMFGVMLGLCIAILVLDHINQIIEKKASIFENSNKKSELIEHLIKTYRSIRNSWWVFLLMVIGYRHWNELAGFFIFGFIITFLTIYSDYKRGIINEKFIRITDSVLYLCHHIIISTIIYFMIN